MTDISAIVARVEALLRRAGKMIIARPEFSVDQKEGHANFVTTVDRSVQALLQTELTRLLPGSRFIGEEQANEPLGDDYTWIVDPVDGTTNLIHDMHMSAVSVALAKERAPILGFVYQPYTDEMFFARKGEGAFLNGKPIRVSPVSFDKALVSFGTSPYDPDLAEMSLSSALRFLYSCADIRRSGSAAIDLANVACGRTEVYFEYTLKPWDYAAGSLLVTEAGGCFAMPFTGRGIDFSMPGGVVAANAACYEQAMKLLNIKE